MLATPSHHTFHRLNRLITTFLAQMRHVPAPVENPVSVKQPGTDDQSNATTDSTQVAPEPTIDQATLPHQAPALSSVPAGRDDERTKGTFVGANAQQEQLSGASTAEYAKRSRIRCKKAFLVINPHAGQNVTKIAELIAVLSAAGWSTDITIKEYGGHSMELAARAAKANYDLVIGYGGDGTLNQVLNGVMNAGRCQSIVGVIPGGTTNVWAAEIGVPHDPVQAALTLINSEARKVDIGHVEVQGLSFPGTAQDAQEKRREKKAKLVQKREVRATTKAKHHFLLMAGLGFDAAIMEHVSKAFKYRVGRLAVGLSVAEELPRHHPFPVEIRVGGTKHEDEKIWKGEAFQVVVGNTRRYANIVQMTPNAYLDDGLLEVCVITAGNTLKTIEQLASLLFRRTPDNIAGAYFEGASITISVPASIDLQLDGSAVRLKDYLNKADRKALQSAGNAEDVMVTYRFDAMPRALQVAIPSTYDGALFEKPIAEEKPHVPLQEQKGAGAAQQRHSLVEEVLHES